MSRVSAQRILTADGWLQDAAVEIGANGLVASVGAGSGAEWTTLVPGFVDVQVNGIDDVDVASAEGSDWDRLGELLLDQGVTAWCPTLVTAPLDRYEHRLDRIVAAQAAAHRRGDIPAIVGIHLEGPFLGGAPGAHRREFLAPIDLDWIDRLPPAVRVVTLAAEQPLAAEATRRLVSRGVVVAIGHSTPTPDQVEATVGAGATMVTHLFNGMTGVSHRDTGLAGLALVDDRLAVGLIADLVHVEPPALALALRAKPRDLVVLVTDSVAWRAASIGEVRIATTDLAPRLADGTLAGSSLTMDRAIHNLVHIVGADLGAMCVAASTNPARLLCLDGRGQIRPGFVADLVALDDECRVVAVWLAGRRVR